MSPYLLFGFLVAGVLSVSLPSRFIAEHLGGRGVRAVFYAALVGVPLPLCSCGVIPVAAFLRQRGAGKGATTAFLISTPQTGVDSILVTYSVLGPIIAAFRPVVAFLSGLLGGAIVDLVEPVEPPGSPTGSPPPAPVSDKPRRLVWQVFHHGFVTLPRDIGKSLVVGLVLAAAISYALPDDIFLHMPGGGSGVGAMLLMMLAGIPLYVCATASVPVAAALIAKGVSPGAAMVFLITGPASNMASVATIWRIMGRRPAVAYLASIAASALAAGFALDGFFPLAGAGVSQAVSACHGVSGWNAAQVCSAFLLAGVLSAACVPWNRLWKPRVISTPVTPDGGAPPPERDGETGHPGAAVLHFQVDGLTCPRCARALELALAGEKGVGRAAVDFPSGTACVYGDPDPALVISAAAGLGYTMKLSAPRIGKSGCEPSGEKHPTGSH